MTSLTVLEEISIVTPLGVRFRDEAARSFVCDRLSVSVHPVGQAELRRPGVPNNASVFVFRNLPGLRELEFGDGTQEYWDAHNREFPFELEVRDEAGRFLPYAVRVMVPQRSIAKIELNSPLASPLAFSDGAKDGFLPLYSSPGRNVPDGMGAFRAELVDIAGGPAAWALVEAKAGPQRLMVGVADALGRVMVPLLYPKPVITLGSPGTINTPLTQQTWRVDVSVRYRRRHPIPEIPDLVHILTQPVAEAYLATSPSTLWTGGTLSFGRELVPATESGQRIPKLLINPAESPL